MTNQTNPQMDISQQPQFSTQTTNQAPDGGKTRTLTLAMLIFLVIACGAAWIYLYQTSRVSQQVTSPAQTLTLLEESSTPDTTTNSEKARILNDLKKGSAQPTMTTEQSLQLLEMLNK